MTEKLKILAVDDQPDNLRVIVAILRERYAVVAAKTGADALKLAQREPQPSLILLDIMMPEMDGFEVCERLKSDPSTANIPVIFISASNDEQEIERGLALGAVDFVHKPVSPALLQLRITRCLEHHSPS